MDSTTCDKCGKEFEFSTETDMREISNDDEEWLIVTCPLCGWDNVFTD